MHNFYYSTDHSAAVTETVYRDGSKQLQIGLSLRGEIVHAASCAKPRGGEWTNVQLVAHELDTVAAIALAEALTKLAALRV